MRALAIAASVTLAAAMECLKSEEPMQLTFKMPFVNRSDLQPRVPPSRCTVLHNGVVWSGEADEAHTSRRAFRGALVLRGNRIAAVIEAGEALPTEIDGTACAAVDLHGRAVIPGMVEGHAHTGFEDIAAMTDPGDTPPEEGVLIGLLNAGRLLEAGFTSAFSAAGVRPRQDPVTRNWINAGRAPGPRLLAASPEITATGNLGDGSVMHQHRDSFGLVADGADEVRAAVRRCLREGADTIKINIGGDLVPISKLSEERDDMLPAYSEAEVRAAVEEAHMRQKRVAAHCRGSADVRMALAVGVDVIYHLDFVHKDSALLDALAAARDHIFVGPAVGLMAALAPSLPDVQLLLDAQAKTYSALRTRGLRVVLGGDYGFRVTPQGTNANDLLLFQRHFGYSPEEALVAATRHGGALMRLPVGQLRPGWLADLLVVEGRPWEDSTPLFANLTDDGSVSTPRIAAIMQDGHFVRNQL